MEKNYFDSCDKEIKIISGVLSASVYVFLAETLIIKALTVTDEFESVLFCFS